MPFRNDPMADLLRRLEALEKSQEELGRRQQDSLRYNSTCPTCRHKGAIHAPSVLDSSAEGRSNMAIIQPSLWSSKTEGELEAYICQKCGFVEWYVKDPSSLGEHKNSREKLRFREGDGSE